MNIKLWIERKKIDYDIILECEVKCFLKASCWDVEKY